MQRTGRGVDTEQSAPITLEQFSYGADLYFTRKKKVICPHCSGKGGSQAMQKCTNCNGSGLHMVATAGGGMTITGCTVCGGSGVIGRCNHCHGSGLVSVDKHYHLVVDAGDAIGKKVRYIGDGDESPNAAIPGDYVVELKPANHATFKVQGNTLYFIVRVPRTMPPPVHVSVKGLNGETLKFEHKGPVNTNDQITIAGAGLRVRNESTGEFWTGPVTAVFQVV